MRQLSLFVSLSGQYCRTGSFFSSIAFSDRLPDKFRHTGFFFVETRKMLVFVGRVVLATMPSMIKKVGAVHPTH
jgi:hypothetical protein